MQLSIDVGHGYVKTWSSRGDRVIFPALIQRAPTTVDLGAFGRASITRIDGDDYLVGEAARRLATPLWSRDKASDDETLRLMLAAAAECGANGPVRLATGLPLAWWGDQRQALQHALHGFGGTVVRPDGRTLHLWFETVLVLPQGVAAAGPVLDQSVYAPGPYLVVDVGYRTTDFIVVTKQDTGALEFDALAAGSLELGMHAVDAALAESLTAVHHTEFTAVQVANAESVVVRGRRLDIQNERANRAVQVARRIARGLTERLDRQMDHLLGLVAVGGGSHLLAQSIPGVIQPADPQWANARGYLAALVAMGGSTAQGEHCDALA